ncbi:hypothetical protein KI387_042985, partial [Taxus chinensis]
MKMKTLWKTLRSFKFHHKHRNAKALGLYREFSFRSDPPKPCFNFSKTETANSLPPDIVEYHEPEIIGESEIIEEYEIIAMESERQLECTEKPENNVDREAERFIAKFHEQLRLQRQSSLLR